MTESIRISEKEKQLLEFIRTQKPGYILVSVCRHQPISFSNNCQENSLRENHILRESLYKRMDKLSNELYGNFYRNTDNFLELCKNSYNLRKNFRLTILKHKLNCSYYLHCQIGFDLPINPDFKERILKIWTRHYVGPTPGSGPTILPKLTDVFGIDACSNCHPNCEICGKELLIKKIRCHHLSYTREAIPSDSELNWLQYYQLLCYKCHAEQRGKVNGHENWAKIVKEELARRESSNDEARKSTKSNEQLGV